VALATVDGRCLADASKGNDHSGGFGGAIAMAEWMA
jgi:hypothetical protein